MLQNYFKTILFLFSFFFFRFFLRVINAARALVKEARSLSLPSPPLISLRWSGSMERLFGIVLSSENSLMAKGLVDGLCSLGGKQSRIEPYGTRNGKPFSFQPGNRTFDISHVRSLQLTRRLLVKRHCACTDSQSAVRRHLLLPAEAARRYAQLTSSLIRAPSTVRIVPS